MIIQKWLTFYWATLYTDSSRSYSCSRKWHWLRTWPIEIIVSLCIVCSPPDGASDGTDMHRTAIMGAGHIHATRVRRVTAAVLRLAWIDHILNTAKKRSSQGRIQQKKLGEGSHQWSRHGVWRALYSKGQTRVTLNSTSRYSIYTTATDIALNVNFLSTMFTNILYQKPNLRLCPWFTPVFLSTIVD